MVTERSPSPREEHQFSIAVVVGNPKAHSRTLDVADTLARSIAEAVELPADDLRTVDLAEYGPELFDWSSARVTEAVAAVRTSSLAVIASPTYKASYTGLLKSFLDWFSSTDLVGVTVVPLMVGAGLQHALAVEVHLRPVLVELGATLPTRGLYVTEGQLEELDDVVSGWLGEAGPRLAASLRPQT
jgi:FMN reductase